MDWAAAALAASLKHAFEGLRARTAALPGAMLLLLGWALSVLLVANLPLAERMGHAPFDGQLYFTDRSHLINASVFAVLAFAGLRVLSRRLLLAHFFPDFFRARGLSERRAHYAFDLVAGAALASATMSVGVMGARPDLRAATDRLQLGQWLAPSLATGDADRRAGACRGLCPGAGVRSALWSAAGVAC